MGQANLIPAMVIGGMARSVLGDLHMAPEMTSDGPVTVLVRPEQLRLTSPGREGLLGGVVTHQEYYGHDAVVRVRINEDAFASAP